MRSNIKTVSIGIPVHNEKENILNLLESIERQNTDGFQLEKIYVICDGTSDGTDKKVIEYAKNHSNITLLNDLQRKGKMLRLMEIYQMNKSEFILIFDGDVVLSTSNVLHELINKFDGKEIAIVGANNQPVSEGNEIEKLINYWSHIWYLTRKNYNEGNNIHNIRGCGMAIRGDFAKTINFPVNVVSDAQFIYFYALKENKKFYFAEKAVILYRKPNTIYDHLLQMKRSEPEKIRLRKLFGNWITKKYKIPLRYKAEALIQSFFSHPILTITSGLLTVVVNIFPNIKMGQKNETVWKRVNSTKKSIPIPF